MPIYSSHRLSLVALGCLVLTACGSSDKPTSPPQPPLGRYRIVEVQGLQPGTREVLQIDTATGSTWRLVPATGSYDDIGWHMVADLTIESRSPYYRARPDLGQPYPAVGHTPETPPQPKQEARP